MNKLIAVILVSLLGFLGCSGSDDGTLAVGEAIPVAPFAKIDTSTPTYEWTPVPWATKYRLLVQDTSETAVIEEWYTAEEGECASEDGLCMVTPDTEVIGENAWKVIACVGEVCGLWSDELSFSFGLAMGPPQERFTVNPSIRGEYTVTVTDNNTGLIWGKTPPGPGCPSWGCDSGGSLQSYSKSKDVCDHWHTNAPGKCILPPCYVWWRLPTVSELNTLIDKSHLGYDVTLPIGHPFTFVRAGFYWAVSTTETCSDPCEHCNWAVNMDTGEWHLTDAYCGEAYYWCVRG